MPRFEHGFKRAIEELVLNPIYLFVYMQFLSAFSSFIPKSQLFAIKTVIWVGNLVLNIEMLYNMEYWSTEYIIGWLFGIVIVVNYFLGPLWKIGILDCTDIFFLVIYTIMPIVILWRRFS